MVFPLGSIETELLSNIDGVCIFRAIVRSETGMILGTGTAYEQENNSYINKTSYIENCETSAVGRALGMAGFGIDTSVASYEEVANAITQQNTNNDTIIDKNKAIALNKSIENNKISDEIVELVLSQYGYSSTSEIQMKDYMNIVNDLSSRK